MSRLICYNKGVLYSTRELDSGIPIGILVYWYIYMSPVSPVHVFVFEGDVDMSCISKCVACVLHVCCTRVACVYVHVAYTAAHSNKTPRHTKQQHSTQQTPQHTARET